MSRVAKAPVTLPNGVEVTLNSQQVSVKGAKGTLTHTLHALVEVKVEAAEIKVSPREDSKDGWMQAASARSVINNLVIGVSAGFERKLQLVGVGYKAAVAGKTINMALGYSHPVNFDLPEGVTAETPTPTEVVLRSSNKHLLGQVAANIRAKRPPEPYKGKGVRYSDEVIIRKEAKKK